MSSSIRRARILLIAAVSACALMAATASAANAANAWFTNPGAVSASSTLTLKQKGANEKTCTASVGGEAINAGEGAAKQGSLFIHGTNPFGVVEYSCTGSTTLWLKVFAPTTYESGFWANLEKGSLEFQSSPYGNYSQTAAKAPWTNGVEGKQSTITFSNTKIGFNGGGDITATGTITVKRSSGEVLTLTH